MKSRVVLSSLVALALSTLTSPVRAGDTLDTPAENTTFQYYEHFIVSGQATADTYYVELQLVYLDDQAHINFVMQDNVWPGRAPDGTYVWSDYNFYMLPAGNDPMNGAGVYQIRALFFGMDQFHNLVLQQVINHQIWPTQ